MGRKSKIIGNILGGLALIALLIFSAYMLVPFVRYLSVPVTGGTPAPTFKENPETAKIRALNQANYFNTAVMGNNTTIVNNIDQVPEQGGWFNTAPLDLHTIAAQDKLILVNFWSVTDLGSYRETPQTELLWGRYRDHGLVVIGVDTPEFAFEKKPATVFNIIHAEGITYPVVTDANREIWKKFGNHFISAQYLVNPRGQVVYTHFGEGDYQNQEAAIRKQLALAGWNLPDYPPLLSPPQPNFKASQTPTLYAGPVFLRKELGNNPQPVQNRTASYTLPKIILPDRIYLAGQWKAAKDYLQSMSNAKIVLNYEASAVYPILGQAIKPVWVEVQLDGMPVSQAMQGKSIMTKNGKTYMQIVQPGLYFPVADQTSSGRHTLTLILPAGLELYAFKFAVF